MADIGDVVTLLAQMANAAAYPNGTTSPSVIGAAVESFGGWPNAASLDAKLAAGGAMISVFPQAGQSAATYQVIDDTPYLVTPAVHGLAASITGQTISLTGTPGAGEFVAVIVNGKSAFSETGSSAAAILAELAADATAAFSGVVAAGNSITFPNSAHSLECRIGATATAGRVVHRQRAMVMVVIWAPTPTARDTLAAAVDAALKSINHLTLPDKSQAIIWGSHSIQIDTRQTAALYRRDLVFSVEYATIQQYQVTEITVFNGTVDAGPSMYGHVADDVIAAG